MVDAFDAALDFNALYFAALAGVLFGIYVAGTAPASEWRPILGWGVMVWLTFVMMANIHRFVENDPDFLYLFLRSGLRWFLFIFSTIASAAIVRYVYWHTRGRS